MHQQMRSLEDAGKILGMTRPGKMESMVTLIKIDQQIALKQPNIGSFTVQRLNLSHFDPTLG